MSVCTYVCLSGGQEVRISIKSSDDLKYHLTYFIQSASLNFVWGKKKIGSGGGRVVKLLACRAEGGGSIPGLATWISEMGYLLLPSRDMAEIPLKRCKFLNTTNQHEAK